MSDPLRPDAGPEPTPVQPAESGKASSCPIPGCGGRSWVLWALLIALALVYFNSNRASSGPSAVPWSEDLQAALAKAKDTHRPVLLKFYATWCEPCKMMEQEVFSRKDVAGALAMWITVGIDGDKNAHTLSRYNIDSVPTLVMLDSDGQEIHRSVGYIRVDRFMTMIKSVEKTLGGATRPGA